MPIIRATGERSLLVDLGSMEEVHRLFAAVRADPPPGTEDVVAGATTVLVMLSSQGQLAAAEAAIRRHLERPAARGGHRREAEIPVVYDGPDLDQVAALAGTAPEDVAGLHSGSTYTVAFLGFSPGFAYLVGAPTALHVPRLGTPRTVVPAGAVAVAAGMTAVYPQATPGGWQLIGRTDARMFDPARSHPSLLRPGDRVRFRPVAELGPPTAPPCWPPATDRIGPSYLQILDPGPLTTVQDRGRIGWAHLGVPRSGAADRVAAAEANRLVGNPPDAALLEATLGGPALRLGAARRVAVTGAGTEVRVDGLPARSRTALALHAGAELRVGPFRTGVRAYVAVEGGIAVAPLLGSRSSDTLSGLGMRALRAGDRLPVGPRPVPGGERAPAPGVQPAAPGRDPRLPVGRVEVTAYRGPRDDWVGRPGMETLGRAEFRVAASSDRTGLRLSGPAVPVARRAELPSEGVVPGAVQIPPDGQPIVLLRNHPTTGGYPVAAVVAESDLDRLAQAAPGTVVQFRIGQPGGFPGSPVAWKAPDVPGGNP